MSEVVYTLTLKDMMTQKLHEADSAANALHSTMSSLFTTLGVGFGVYQLFDYFKDAADEVQKIHTAQSQLQAGLQSTHHAAGISMEELEAGADKLSHSFQYTKGQIMDMQAIMLTFPGVTEKTFGGASQAILDMSTRLHKGADEVAIMVGKALQHPERGITALRRIGVNFDTEQTNRIKRMVEQGRILQAQAAIMTELQTEFAGSAAAAAAADPLFEYKKTMEETQEAIGNVVVEIQQQLAPTLLYLAERFRDLVDWVKKNGEQLWNIIKALGAMYIAFKTGSLIMAGYTAFMEGFTVAEVAATTATEGFAVASTAALGPIGLLAAAVGGLVYLYNTLGDAEDNAALKQKTDYQKAGVEETAQMQSLVSINSKTMGIADAVVKAKADETNAIQAMWDSANNRYDDLIAKMGNNEDEASKSDEGKAMLAELNILNEKKRVAGSYTNSPQDLLLKTPPPPGTTNNNTNQETKGAKGNKAVTINIKIDALQKGDIKIMTTNIKEGAGKIQEMITQSLMNAVNNSQIIGNY